MPPRLLCWAIILFWLGATTWLVVRDVAPGWRTGEPPPFVIDLTEEVSAQTIGWMVYSKDERVGNGVTRIQRRNDRTFEMYGDFKFDRSKVQKLTGRLHVTEQGELLAFSFDVKAMDIIKGHMNGTVDDKNLTVKAKVDAPPLFTTGWLTFEAPRSGRGSIMDPMMPLNRLAGLREGQSWAVPMVSAMDMVKQLPVAGLHVPTVHAHVHAAVLDFQQEKVSCLRVDYTESGKEPIVQTWVRRRDGVVLQQEVAYEVLKYRLVRDIAK